MYEYENLMKQTYARIKPLNLFLVFKNVITDRMWTIHLSIVIYDYLGCWYLGLLRGVAESDVICVHLEIVNSVVYEIIKKKN